nr:YeeE/YedE family protein [uncultured Celeribacter sp.]
MRHLLTYLTGLLFGLGISMSGMANPAKVLNFFDFAGTWDPSLIFVMGGAVVVAFVGYRVLFARYQAPAFESRFVLPGNRKIDVKLIGGSLIFGVGWGIAGFCPGGALPALGTGKADVWIFSVALVVGILGTKAVLNRMGGRTL